MAAEAGSPPRAGGEQRACGCSGSSRSRSWPRSSWPSRCSARPGLGERRGPPAEDLVVDKIALHPGVIELTVRNDGPDAVAVKQVIVNDGYVNFTSKYERSAGSRPTRSRSSTRGSRARPTRSRS